MQEAPEESWKAAWAPVTALVGQDFGDPDPPFGPVIERGAIWRYLEPLEFDCPLHYDLEVAVAHGYADVVLPATAVQTFSLPPAWMPGERTFVSDARNAQPDRTATGGPRTGCEPPCSGFFAVDYEVDYLRSACAGDRLRRRGARLQSCEPRETRVGRGAFLTWESSIVNQRDEEIARLRTTYFRYQPREQIAP